MDLIQDFAIAKNILVDKVNAFGIAYMPVFIYLGITYASTPIIGIGKREVGADRSSQAESFQQLKIDKCPPNIGEGVLKVFRAIKEHIRACLSGMSRRDIIIGSGVFPFHKFWTYKWRVFDQ